MQGTRRRGVWVIAGVFAAAAALAWAASAGAESPFLPGQSAGVQAARSAKAKPAATAAADAAAAKSDSKDGASKSDSKDAKAIAKSDAKTASKPAATTKSAAAAKEVKPRVAHMRLGGAVLDSPPGFNLFGDGGYMTLRDWLQRLAKARNDDAVAAVALEIDQPEMSWAQAQELADAVRRLNETKPVYAFVTEGGASEYLVASAAREVAMEPMGTLMITGLGAELTFFRGTLNLLSIEPQMIQVGKYKGAAEPFDRTEPSPELAGEYNKILDDLFDQLCGQIARQRKLKFDQVRQAIDTGPFCGEPAAKCKFVDRLITRTDWQKDLTQKATGKLCQWTADYGQKPPVTLDLSNPFALLGALGRSKGEEVRDPTIAIINCNGMIVDGVGGEGLLGGSMVGSRTLVKCFQEMADDNRVKAVIFRIDSPGGSALASEMIYQAAKACAAKKPVIASIAQTGASGGYYVALGAKTIYADSCGLVGSIGVVSGKLAFKGLMNKVGITTTEMTRGANAGLMLSRPWTDREKEIMRTIAEKVYGVFTARVQESRGKKIGKIEDVAQGRIFTARQACANGLVDQVGGLREAILAAQAAANIDTSYFITLPKPRSLLEMMSSGGDAITPIAPASAEMAILSRLAKHSPGLVHMLNLADLLGKESVLAVMPHHVAVKH